MFPPRYQRLGSFLLRLSNAYILNTRIFPCFSSKRNALLLRKDIIPMINAVWVWYTSSTGLSVSFLRDLLHSRNFCQKDTKSSSVNERSMSACP